MLPNSASGMALKSSSDPTLNPLACGSGRATTSGYLFLDVRYLQRNGYLRPGTGSSQRWSRRGEPFASINLNAWDGHVTLSYSTRDRGRDAWERKEYPVSLEWTR